MSTMISTSFLFASETNVTRTDYAQQLSSLLEQAKQQCAWNRETKNDYHVQTPQILGKKLDINVPQVAHIVLIAGILYSLDPLLHSYTHKHKNKQGKITWEEPRVAISCNNDRAWSLPLLLLCVYRYVAGEQKNPVKVVD